MLLTCGGERVDCVRANSLVALILDLRNKLKGFRFFRLDPGCNDLQGRPWLGRDYDGGRLLQTWAFANYNNALVVLLPNQTDPPINRAAISILLVSLLVISPNMVSLLFLLLIAGYIFLQSTKNFSFPGGRQSAFPYTDDLAGVINQDQSRCP